VSLEPILHVLAGILQVFGGAMFVLGLFTPFISFILCGEMAIAWLISHAPYTLLPFYSGESAVLDCLVFLLYFLWGGGAWSLDQALFKKGSRSLA
jgi:putative oxidoreductase